MGTLLRMPLYITDNVCALAQSVGLRTFACVPASDAQRISDIAFSDGDMLLIGNEANGLLKETIEASDFRITIPMAGRAESLNAAAAAAIAMWEMLK
jgi:TrmH family RNA methyltransferase